MKMKNNEDPELFINTLEKLDRRMNEDFNMKILYEDIINKRLRSTIRLTSSSDGLRKVVTLDNLKEQLRSKFQQMIKNKSRPIRH